MARLYAALKEDSRVEAGGRLKRRQFAAKRCRIKEAGKPQTPSYAFPRRVVSIKSPRSCANPVRRYTYPFSAIDMYESPAMIM